MKTTSSIRTLSMAFGLAASGWAACATPAQLAVETEHNFRESALDRASFELGCPKEKLSVTVLRPGYTPVGVQGCGKRAVYDWSNSAGYVLTSEVTTIAPGTEPARDAVPAGVAP